MAEHARDARPHVFRQLFDRGIGMPAELQVDPPDVVRLLVQQRGASGMEWRIEPEPALGRKRGRHLDVGDQELILEYLPCEFRTHHLPQRGSGAVAGDDVLRIQPIRTVRRLDRQQHIIVARLERRHLVAPAQVDSREFADAVDQIGLGIELLQVDEGRPLVALLRQQVELVELLSRRERSCRRSTPRPCRPCAGRCRAGPRIRASVLRSRSPASPRRSGRRRRAAPRTGRAAPDRSPATAPPDRRRPRRSACSASVAPARS